MAELLVPISPGELIDKITILEIKSARMTDAAKLHNVRTELALLNETWRASAYSADRHHRGVDRPARRQRAAVGHRGPHPRQGTRRRCSTREFIELARAVYVTNDERAAIKRRINTQLGSSLVEEKSYREYRK